MSPEEYLNVIEKIAVSKGWRPNPDREILLELSKGLLENRKRYGRTYCPCRIVTGNYDIDKKIICPCVYAQDDIDEHGRCFCGLYVSMDVYEGKRETPVAIPDRHAEMLFTSNK